MFTRRTWSYITAVLFSFALIGCGGGGADTGNPLPDPVQNDPDVLATDPAPFESNVAESREIHIEFSIALDPTAPFQDFLRVATPSGPLPGTWTYDDAERRATFAAAEHLVIGAEHTVTVASGLRYDDGTARSQDFEFEFEVRPPAFLPPDFLEQTDDVARSHRLDVHYNGNGMSVMEIELPDGRTQFVSRRRQVGGAFEAPKTIVAGDNIQALRLVVGRNGNAALAWRQGSYAQPGSTLRMSYFDRQADQWRAARTLESDPLIASTNVGVVMDGSGNAIFSWLETNADTDATAVATRRYQTNGVLEGTQYYDGFSGTVGALRLAGNDRGDAIVAWDEPDAGGVRSAYAATYRAGGTWSSQEPLETFAETCRVAEVEMASNGYAVVLFSHFETADDLGTRMRVAAFEPFDRPNPGWKPARPLHTDLGDLNTSEISVAANGEFVVTYVLELDAQERGEVRAVRFKPETGDLVAERLSIPLAPEMCRAGMDMSLSRGGDLVVVWTEEQFGVQEELRAAVWLRDGSLTRNILLRRLVDDNRYRGFDLAAEPGGGGTVVWGEPDPNLGGEPARRLASIRIQPNGLTSATDFINPTPGDRAESADLVIDNMGLGVLVWRHVNSANDDADIRYRELR